MTIVSVASSENVSELEGKVTAEILKLGFTEDQKEVLLSQMKELDICARILGGSKASTILTDRSREHQVLTELLAVYYERSEPMVLVSDSDAAHIKNWRTRLLGESIHVQGFKDLDALSGYVDNRHSEQFFLTGIVIRTDDASNQKVHSLIDKIRAVNKKPLYVLVESPGKATHICTFQFGQDTPGEYFALHRVYQERLGLRLPSTNIHLHSVGFLEQQIAHFEQQITTFRSTADPLPVAHNMVLEQNEFRHELADRYRSDSSRWSDAMSVYTEILDRNPNDARAIQRRAGLYLRRSLRPSLAEFAFASGKGQLKGVDALIAYLHDHAKKLDLPEVDYLLGKAHVVSFLESESQPLQVRGTVRQDLDLAINHLERFNKHVHSFDAQIYLGLARIFRNENGDRQKAYRIINDALFHSDPVTEELTAESRFELDLEDRSRDVMGSRLAQLIGLHRVFMICDDAVVKKFERDDCDPGTPRYEQPGEGKRAALEVANIEYLNNKSSQLFLESGNSREPIIIPAWSILIESERPKDAYVFEVMQRIPGLPLDQEFERLNNISTATENEARRLDEKKISHLEWVVDLGMQIQLVSRDRPGLKDTRKEKYKINIGDRNYEVGHYTYRFFTKVLDTLEKFVSSPISLSATKKLRFVNLLKQLEQFLYKAPSEFFVPYTDKNIRNFIIEVGSDGIVRKGRVDFENSDTRLWLGDDLSSIEHELAYMRTGPGPSNAISPSKYLINRSLSNLLIGQGAPARHVDGKRLYARFKREVLEARLGSNWRQRRAKEQKTLFSYVEHAFGFTELDRLILYESAFRHLTIFCDKLREADRIGKFISSFEKKHEDHSLKDWPIEGSFRQIYQAMNDPNLHQRTGDFAVRKMYAYLRAQLEDVVKYKHHHFKHYTRAVNEIKIKLKEDPFLCFAEYIRRNCHLSHYVEDRSK